MPCSDHAESACVPDAYILSINICVICAYYNSMTGESGHKRKKVRKAIGPASKQEIMKGIGGGL
jgi:hypothetical protein